MEALREWMLRFVDYMATKQGMSEALNSIVGGTFDLHLISNKHTKIIQTSILLRAPLFSGSKIGATRHR